MAISDSAIFPGDVVSQVGPVLHEYAAKAEATRRLAPEAMTALLDADLLRAWVPRAYGGAERPPVPVLRMFEELARIDSAAGWIVANSTGISTLTAMFPEAGTAEMFADARALCAGGWFPPGKAEPVAGGYRVSGQLAFGSGCHYATWLTGQAIVHESGTPRLGPDGRPEAIIVFARADEAEIVDTWRTLGMRGTGSHDFRLAQVFVPERRCWTVGPFETRNPAYAGPLYRLGLWLVGPVNASVALGIARAAVDDVITLARAKTPSYTQTGLADKPTVQDRIARARAEVEAARSYLYGAVAEAWEHVQSGPRLDIEHGMPLALAGSFAIEAACRAVDLVHAMAGTTAIRDEHRFQQYFRDVHTVSQHAFSSPNRFESLGKLMLGRECDWAFYYL
jgi:indole-3-acetate monooxygenase